MWFRQPYPTDLCRNDAKQISGNAKMTIVADNLACGLNLASLPKLKFLESYLLYVFNIHTYHLFFHLVFSHVFHIALRGSSGCTKGHSLCKQCLYDLHLMKQRILLTKPFQASQSWHQLHQFLKTRSWCRTIQTINGLYTIAELLNHFPTLNRKMKDILQNCLLTTSFFGMFLAVLTSIPQGK